MSFFSPIEFKCRCGRPAGSGEGQCDAPPVKLELTAKLNALRALWGKPLIITSGVRCAYWNEKVGGVPTSYHLTGHAADIKIDSFVSGESLKALARKVGFGGIGLAEKFLHVDIGPVREWSYPAKS